LSGKGIGVCTGIEVCKGTGVSEISLRGGDVARSVLVEEEVAGATSTVSEHRKTKFNAALCRKQIEVTKSFRSISWFRDRFV
jgi:hypothetical protein